MIKTKIKKCVAVASALLLFVSCSNETEQKFVKTDRERDSLLKLANEREQSVNEFIATFNEIERNLDSVSVKQHVIYVNTDKKGHELLVDRKTRINAEIASINGLMKQNADKIEDL